MTNLTPMQQLHDKETRGEILTETEQLLLTNWHAQQDALESAALRVEAAPEPDVIQALREQVASSLTELQRITEQIQTLTEENQAIRRDINALHQRLSQTETVAA